MQKQLNARAPLKRFVLDFFIGLLIFGVAVGLVRVSEGRAYLPAQTAQQVSMNDALALVGMPTLVAPRRSEVAPNPDTSLSKAYAVAAAGPNLSAGRGRPAQSFVAALAIAFATVTALNLALVRHVGRLASDVRRPSELSST